MVAGGLDVARGCGPVVPLEGGAGAVAEHAAVAQVEQEFSGRPLEVGPGPQEPVLVEDDQGVLGPRDEFDGDARGANVRAGYVYVISNIGAFGEHMIKIGLTRRLDPMDRVHELGDASVPFRFDVHALIFSEDAVGLERSLHKEFENHRVNRVNLRREFFYVRPAEVREALQRYAGQHLLEFHEQPEAPEWRASGPRGK